MKLSVKFAAMLTAAVLLFTAAAPLRVGNTARAEETIDSLREKIEALNQQQQTIKQELAYIQDESQRELRTLQALWEEIASLEEEIDVYRQIIEQLDGEIDVLVAELESKQAGLDLYLDKYYMRVRANYEAGQTSYLEVLLTSASFSDYLTRTDIVSQIMEYDNKLMDEMAEKIEEVNRQKEQVEAKRAEQQSAKDELDAKQASLQQKRDEAQSRLDNLSQQALNLNNEYENAQEQIDEFSKTLDDLISASGEFSGIMSWPTPGYTYITSHFGWRSDPFTGAQKYHSAIDIGSPMGSKLIAAASGTVVATGYEYAGGRYIMIDHKGGVSTRYYHLSEIHVSEGQWVERGEQIGLTGMSGAAVTGPHLHFEVRVKNANGVTEAQNPLDYVSPS